jgi:cell division transport system ATP-binding protein
LHVAVIIAIDEFLDRWNCLAMLTLKNVCKVYPPAQTALSGVSILAQQGDFVFVAGASGAGKSTLLKLLYGAEGPSSGELVVCDQELHRMKRSELAAFRRSLGIIFQDYKLLPRQSVLENVALSLEVQGVTRPARLRRARMLLEEIGLGDKADQLPPVLSGGEQQRVAVARALIHRPRMILADEPTGNLDHEMAKVVFDLLMEANAAGVTVVVATHDLAMIEGLGYRTVVLDRGRVLGDFEGSRRGGV